MHRQRRFARIAAIVILLAAVLGAARVHAATTAHIVNLATVPGSVGNGTLFSGSVCWIGDGSTSGCYPGYANNVSQIVFKSFAIPAGSHWYLSYDYRSDCQPDSDQTYVIIDESGIAPSIQPSGCYALTSQLSLRDTVSIYSGSVEGNDLVDLMPYAGKTICVVVNSVSGPTGSDQDCLFPSTDGLFAFDDPRVDTMLTTFDTGANGWAFGCLTQVDSLIVSTVGSGSVTRNPNLAVYERGSSVQLTAVPSAGWHFVGWSGSASGSTNPLSVLMTGKKTITATFAADVIFYTLNVSISGQGTVNRNPDQPSYASGTIVQLTANPNAGWVFAGWSGDAIGSSNPTNVTMNSNKSVTATFTQPSSSGRVYPPGPAYRSCPDTLTIFEVEQADTTLAPCHPAVGDTVLGLRGIVIGMDRRPTSYATYFQTLGGGQFTGLQAFTGATNYNASVPSSPSGGNLAIGDHIVVYGTIQEFPAVNGTTEIEGPDLNQSTNDILIRKLSSGNAVPMDIVTTSQLNWLPAFSQGEKYEGGLVRIRGPLKVARTAGAGIVSPNYLLTTIIPSGDSVLVDPFTLDPAAPGAAPVIGTVVDSVQGVVNQNTGASINSYRIQLRNGNDVFLAVPPSLSDAYPIEDNQIRVVFDRNLDPTTAQNASNYSLGSAIDGSTVDTAVMPNIPGSIVVLTITSVLTDGETETISVLGVGAASCPTCLMSPAQQRSFANGVMTCRDVQTPDDAALPMFDDRSRFAGAGTLPGIKLTYRGIMVHQFGSVYYMMDQSSQIRGGLSVFAPLQPLVPNHRYRIAGQVQEFLGETEIVNTVFITDEGTGTIPGPIIQPVSVFRDTTTDSGGSAGDPDGTILTGEDYETMLVRLSFVRVTETRLVGQSWFVAGQQPTYPDTILVSNLSGALNAYTPPDSAATISVTGVLHFTNGTFRVCPRGASDITVHGLGVGVDDPIANRKVRFAVSPNPARVCAISFDLPRHERVELGVFDLQGRQVVALARGALPAGTYIRKWNGTDASGQRVNPGVYFYRLKVGSEQHTQRGVLLQ